MESHFELTDAVFESQFQTGTLTPALFNHEAHLRLAWIHIRKYGVDQAVENVTHQLLLYVEALGAKNKYNKTLTVAAVKAVNHFINKADPDNFKDFIETFPRLKYNFEELMSFHYQADIYNSAMAKATYLEPDLLPFS